MPPSADAAGPAPRRRGAALALAIAVTVLVALAARLVAGAMGVGIETTLALVGGLAVGAIGSVRQQIGPEIRAVSGTALRLGVALLGARFTLDQVVQGGVGAAIGAATIVGAGLAVGLWAGRRLGLGGSLGVLIPAGMAVCGNSAILALAPVIRARPQETTYAVATITLFGLGGTLILPFVAGLLGLSSGQAGTWMGLSINDTAQVVAAGYAISEPAGDTATLVKLVRNLAIGPILIAAAFAARGSGSGAVGRVALAKAVPLFVVGFVALAVARSTGLLDLEIAGSALYSIMATASAALILAALAGLGVSADLRATLQVGLRPLGLGIGLWVMIVLLGLGLALALGGGVTS